MMAITTNNSINVKAVGLTVLRFERFDLNLPLRYYRASRAGSLSHHCFFFISN